ncbi:MAG: hypothetical protein WCK33_04430 [Phycisphaerae bacterium]
MSQADRDTSTRAGEAIGRVVAALAAIRARARLLLVSQRTLAILALLLGATIVMAALDYLLRFPSPLRQFHLAAGMIGGLLLLRVRLAPAATFAPSLTDVALRVERAAASAAPELRGVLATGVDFARLHERPDATMTPAGAAMVARVQQDAAERYRQAASKVRLFDLSGLGRALLMVLLAAIPAAACLAIFPTHARIGLARTLTPWTEASWPKRTGVALADMPYAFPLGVALPVRASLTATDRPPGRTSVMLCYRVIASGRQSEIRKAPMTAQGRKANEGTPLEGELFERLLDPDAMQVAGVEAGGDVTLEYWFETSDDRSATGEVLVVPAPAIRTATAVVQPPAYAAALMRAAGLAAGSAAGSAARASEWVAGEADALPSGPSRGVIGPVLAGSKVTLLIEFNKDLPAPALGADAAEVRHFVRDMLPGLEEAADLAFRAGGASWELSFTASAPLRVVPMLRDEHGITGSDDAAFKLEVTQDRPPAAAIIDPAQDEAVLATAVLDVTGEGRDDVAVAGVEVVRQVAKLGPAEGRSPGAVPEAAGPAEVIARADAQPGEPITDVRSATATLALASLGLAAGDEIWLQAAVRDLLLASGGGTGGQPVLSPRRRLRIIGETELIEQVRAELAGLREAAKRAEADQSRLSARREAAAGSVKEAESQLAAQQALGERLGPMKDVVSRLQGRAKRNQLKDEALSGVLRDAAELAGQAKAEGDKASDALDRLSQQASPEDPAAKAAAEQLSSAQRGVENALSELAGMLDRGEDDWAVRRSIEKLLTEQRQLASRTATSARSMQGKAASELTPQQRAELEKLAAEQKELSGKSQSLVNTAQERATRMESTDKAQSQAMQAAADKARSSQLSRRQEEASEQIAANRTGEAQQRQEEAAETLESMLQELDKTQQRKDEALRRVLADVQQSIRTLIEAQQAHLGALADVMAGRGKAQGLDQGMIVLHQNTLGVQQTVRSQVKGGERLVTLLGAATESQTAAIAALRAAPADQPGADASERTSLARLKDALAEAERLDHAAEEREEDRRRDELRKAYAQMLEVQLAVAADVQPMVGQELDRRRRAAARALGAKQLELKERMSQVRSGTEGLGDAAIFDFAHRRYDAAAGSAGRSLESGETPESTVRDVATATRILQGLVAALDEAKKQRDEFKDDEGGGGGGMGGEGEGQKQPMIPPIAELKLLRAMQAEAAERTRVVSDGRDDLESVATLQAELAKFGQALLDKLKDENEEGEKPAKEQP